LVLITGSAGYIGGFLQGVGVDDLSTGKGKTDHVIDIRDSDRLARVLRGVDVVVHLAGVKDVPESVSDPVKYWERNLVGTLRLCEAMLAVGVNKMVFASSAAVYGPTPYGKTKIVCEKLLENMPINAAILRLFNVGGGGLKKAIESGSVVVHGNDYDTKDGTCERDYVHELDVVDAINKSVDYLMGGGNTFCADIGTGVTTSVLEAVRGTKYAIGPRRVGDIPMSVAHTDAARRVLGFEAKRKVF